jgi:hypothetical protein
MSSSNSVKLPKANMGATGYTPDEAATILVEAGFTATAKQVRRAIRKGQVKATQVSGRWYISRRTVTSMLKASEAAAKEEEVPSPTS